MKKYLQTSLLILTVTLGVSARIGILGWLSVFGYISIVLFSLIHFVIHFYSMNYITRKNFKTILYITVSHLSFLGLFFFQFDFDDSKEFSAIGAFLHLENDITFLYSSLLLGLSLLIYIFISLIILIKAKKEKKRKGNLWFLIIAIISTIILSFTISVVLPTINLINDTKEFDRTNYPKNTSERLDSVIGFVFPNNISQSQKIEDNNDNVRWVNDIFTNVSLTESNCLSLFNQIDSLCLQISNTNIFTQKEIVYNFYFPENTEKINSNTDRIDFFEDENFDSKYRFHYRVDCNLVDSSIKIYDRKLYKNISEQLESELSERVMDWAGKNKIINISRLYPSHQQDINQNLYWIKFVIETNKGKLTEVLINMKDFRIETCGNSTLPKAGQ